MLTELVDNYLGSMDPVKVRLSFPSKFNDEDGQILVNVQVIVSAGRVSLSGMIPILLYKIGKWSPHVGSSSRVQVRV